jgi:hypothetical protein
MLSISRERLGYIIEKAREWGAEVPVDPDAASGSDPADDDERQIPFDSPDNPSAQELRDAIDRLNIDEREELLGFAGDFEPGSHRFRSRGRCLAPVEEPAVFATRRSRRSCQTSPTVTSG